MSFTSSVPTFAAEQFNKRAGYAAHQVRQGKWDRAQARTKLAPWLAMALLCGADIDDLKTPAADRNELHDAIADRRVKNTDGSDGFTEGQARWLVADDIAPRRIWVPELTRARDAAIQAVRTDDEPSQMLAAGFVTMVMLIGTDPDGHYSVPPYVAPEPMREAA